MTDIAADERRAPSSIGEDCRRDRRTRRRGRRRPSDGAFRVRLDNFEGPFDLLLNLISRRQLDVTEVALSQVTDEFISYLAAMETWDLGKATEFLVVAATLLDLKAARLLPAAEVEDEEDLALLEARDLLFARLLQYRAYKLAAAYLGRAGPHRSRAGYGRAVELEPRFAALLPEVLIGVEPARSSPRIAAAAMVPKPVPVVMTDHVHAPQVSVREHMAILRERLRRHGLGDVPGAGRRLHADLEVVARFLGLLELYRDGSVAFDQAAALAELRVRWTGGADDDGRGRTTRRRRSTGERARDSDRRDADGARLSARPSWTTDDDELDDQPDAGAAARAGRPGRAGRGARGDPVRRRVAGDRRRAGRRRCSSRPSVVQTRARPAARRLRRARRRHRAARGRRRRADLHPRPSTPRRSSSSCSTGSAAG